MSYSYGDVWFFVHTDFYLVAQLPNRHINKEESKKVTLPIPPALDAIILCE
jgi:hypothetical protein